MNFVLGVTLATVTFFVWSAISWMALPWQRGVFKSFGNQDALRSMRMRLPLFLLTAVLAYPALAESAMELNRAGRWVEAAAVAAGEIENPDVSLQRRCEAYLSLAYAEVRLARYDAAREHLATLEQACSDSGVPWLAAEVERIRLELAGASGPTLEHSGREWDSVPDPATVGLVPTVLVAHERLCEESGADACMLVHGGRIVQEWYGSRYREPMYAMSATKSVTGLLVGMLVEDEKLAADDPVGRYIPEWRAGAAGGVTVRHLLTMTSGLPRMFEDGVGGVEDKESFVFGLSLADKPGTRWAYSNEGVFLLSPVLERAAGVPLDEYARQRLFEPLGMRRTRLHVFPRGQVWTHAEMETTPRDLARIGLLMLQRGKWESKEVVPAKWVEASTRPSQDLQPNYGLLWWLYSDPPGFAALGYLETNLYVFPGLDLVAVRMQSRPSPGARPYEPTALGLFKRLRAGDGATRLPDERVNPPAGAEARSLPASCRRNCGGEPRTAPETSTGQNPCRKSVGLNRMGVSR